ncbi:hypothetical protein DFH09DRAFT_1087477 [Mycena vulgaris]|nr:hypothetical protein DFH09DRAFT_1087477 [Mycena vulgaris]
MERNHSSAGFWIRRRGGGVISRFPFRGGVHSIGMQGGFSIKISDTGGGRGRLKKNFCHVKNGSATLITPPLGFNHFKTTAAIKKKAVANVAVLPAATPLAPLTPAPPVAQLATPYPNPYQYHLPFPPPLLMGYPPYPSYYLPGLYGYPLYMLPLQETPRSHRRMRSWDGSSPPQQSSSKRRRQEPDPPSSPVFSGGSLDEFIAKCPNLPPEASSLLRELGFEIGGDLSVVTEVQ